MNVYYDSPSAATRAPNNSGDFTTHAYGCVYKASSKTWYIQEPLGEPISLDSAGMRHIVPFFENAIRCEFCALSVLPVAEANKQKALKKRLKQTDEMSFLSDDDSGDSDESSSTSQCTGKTEHEEQNCK